MVQVMKNNLIYFLLTLATMALAGFLLWQIYQEKQNYGRLQAEYANYKKTQEEKQEYATAHYLSFSFKYPLGWHLALFFSNNDTTKTYAMSPYPINFTMIAPSRGLFELTIYEDPERFTDEFWQKEQERYLVDLDFVETEQLSTEYGEITFYKGKEKQANAPGQNVEVYFYRFTDGEGNVRYLKLELLYVEDFRLTKMLRDIILSVQPL